VGTGGGGGRGLCIGPQRAFPSVPQAKATKREVTKIKVALKLPKKSFLGTEAFGICVEQSLSFFAGALSSACQSSSNETLKRGACLCGHASCFLLSSFV